MESDKGRIGAGFAEFLDEQGIREEVEGQAVKELDRLLDPANPSVTLATLQRAAKAVGRHLTIALS